MASGGCWSCIVRDGASERDGDMTGRKGKLRGLVVAPELERIKLAGL